MANVIIIHGTGGSPNGNWFPWLKLELEKLKFQVFVPKFPTPKGQLIENWIGEFEKYKTYLDSNAIVIGHSLGPAFLLNVIQKLEKPIGAAYFVAGFTGSLGLSEFDELNKSFAEKKFDWKNIRNNCKRFVVINSDNDPYVPLSKGQELAGHLGAEFVVLENAGHINIDSGFKKFERLLEIIKEDYFSENSV